MIDIQDALGALLALPSTPEEPEAGHKKRLKFAPKVQIECNPEGLDQFLDNTQAGTQPSAVLWWPGVNPADGKWFPRWLGIVEFEIAVNADLPMMLKLMTPPAKGEAPEEWERTRIAVAVEVRAKKLYAKVSANAVIFDLRTECYPTDSDQHLLHELLKCEKLLVSYYQPQADLVQAPATAPRGEDNDTATGSDGKVVPIKRTRGRKGAEPPKVGVEDALFPDAVQHVVTTRKATIPDLQLKLKVSEERATAIIAAMYELDVIGPADGDGLHEVRWHQKDIDEANSKGAEAIPAGGAATDIE